MSTQAKAQMKIAAERDQSCIDCHKGIAHALPEHMNSGDGTLDKLEAMATSGYKTGESYYSVRQLPLFTDKSLTTEAGQFNAATKVTIIDVQADAIKLKLMLGEKQKALVESCLKILTRILMMAS